MKEIHHRDNQHLDAANRIRAEAKENGFTGGFLNYGDPPVRSPFDMLYTRTIIDLTRT